jgi:hypothetical protein
MIRHSSFKRAILGSLLLMASVGCASQNPSIVNPAVATSNVVHLVQDNKPRFALLVGVDDYAQPEEPALRVTPLQGPGNDVELMKSLLVKQYGFTDDKTHIVTLEGKQATRAAILENFKSHLIGNSQKHKDAVVLFYFSGHGSTTEDKNNDEGDGIDETLVAYDSRQDGGNDIVDDDINALFEELRKNTNNISFVLDSCHSGSATRDLSLTAKRLPPNPNMSSVSSDLRGKGLNSKEVVNEVLPRNEQYAVLSGSLPDELSHEMEIPEAKKVHGLLTYYLVDTLKRSPKISYEQAKKEVQKAVGQRAPSQHPQAEGAVGREVFGGAGNIEDPYIAILKKEEGKTFIIHAGASLGLQEGAILAVYSSTANKLSGEEGKLANARLTKVGHIDSTAELLDEPKSPISESDKVVIVTPYYGMHPMSVYLTDLPRQKTSEEDKKLLRAVAKALDKNQLVSVSSDPKSWDLAIQRGCTLENGSLLLSSQLQDSPNSCHSSYYVAPRDQDYALFNFSVNSNEGDTKAQKLVEVLERQAKRENLRRLDNAVSPLEGKLKLSLIDVAVDKDPMGGLVTKSESEIENTGIAPMTVGDYFKLKVKNDSDKDLYVSLIVLGSSGRIRIWPETSSGSEKIVAGKSITMPQGAAYTAGRPLGIETYKLIATTVSDVNFRVLESPGVSRDIATSPLEWLLNQSVNTKTRDSEVAKDLDLNNWTTATIDIAIKEKPDKR